MAETLDLSDVVGFLTENMNEELAIAEKMTAAANPILSQAADEPEQDTEPKTGKEKYADKKSKEDEAEATSELAKHR